MCFVVRKTTSKLERAILTTLYLVGEKHQQLACEEWGFAACFSSRWFNGSESLWIEGILKEKYKI
jgi:hypothetical protein